MKLKKIKLYFVTAILFSSCSPFTTDPVPGPDKQGVGTYAGAGLGAGAGAVIGNQLASGATSGAWIGSAFGAVYGMFQGIGIDILEEDQIKRMIEEQRLQELAWAQQMLAQHYARRLELHPNRDIFPADWFFDSDNSKINERSAILARELGSLTKQRMPWSRIMIVSYVTVEDKNSAYAQYLTKKRAEEIATEFINAGVEPRRIVAQGSIVSKPLILDPNDDPNRYRQAIEIVAMDK